MRPLGPRGGFSTRIARSERVVSTLYVETSALLRVALEGDTALRRRFADTNRLVTSGLTWVEADRALRRAVAERRLPGGAPARARRWIDAFLASCDEIVLDSRILSGARHGFPVEPVRTLDALHLASILAWDQAIDRLAVASCDDRVRANAAALGFDLVPD
jgi:hypothetical protein